MIIGFKPLSTEKMSRLRMNFRFFLHSMIARMQFGLLCGATPRPPNCRFSAENLKIEEKHPSLSPPTHQPTQSKNASSKIFMNLSTTTTATALAASFVRPSSGRRGGGGSRKSIPRSQSPKSGGCDQTSSLCFVPLH